MAFSAPDRALMAERPDLRQVLLRSQREALRPTARGLVVDMALVAGPWGFGVADLRVPVDVWQGEADTNVPPAMGRWFEREIPVVRARFFPGEGHLAFANHLSEILEALLSPGPPLESR